MTEQALISAKETSDGISSAIGLNKGMFTWDNLLSAAIALVVCILAIMIIMKILRKMFSRSKMEPSLAGFILKVIKIECPHFTNDKKDEKDTQESPIQTQEDPKVFDNPQPQTVEFIENEVPIIVNSANSDDKEKADSDQKKGESGNKNKQKDDLGMVVKAAGNEENAKGNKVYDPA